MKIPEEVLFKVKIPLLWEILLLPIFSIFVGCYQNPQPKPEGYFRIDLPENHYTRWCLEDRFCLKHATSVKVKIDPLQQKISDFVNLDYPEYNATIHLSYKPISNNFDTLTEDCRSMAFKQIQKANAIEQHLIEEHSRNVYGIVYDIKGIGAASPCQFFLTDTTTHFLRGALYFNLVPNNDSLAPVIEYIRKDIDTLIGTLEWR